MMVGVLAEEISGGSVGGGGGTVASATNIHHYESPLYFLALNIDIMTWDLISTSRLLILSAILRTAS
jgi:hypothetical protein